MSIEINIEKAYKGDCIWIRYGETNKTNIIIDSGPATFKRGFRELMNKIEKMKEYVDLMILTHIDNDHIMGLKHYLQSNKGNFIKEVWVNGEGDLHYKNNNLHSPKNITHLISQIKSNKIKIETPVIRGHEKYINGAKLTVITPKKEDMIKVAEIIEIAKNHCNESNFDSLDDIYIKDKFQEDPSKTNKACISFIFQYKKKKIAFLGDAHSNDIIEGINKYFKEDSMDLVKISHHGSKYNTSVDLIKALKSQDFIITTNNVVDKEVIARIVNCIKYSNINCNYKWWSNINYFTEKDKQKYINTGRLIITENTKIMLKEDR